MKRNFAVVFALVFACMILLGQAASAYEDRSAPQAPASGDEFIIRFDRNGDQLVSQEEFSGPDKHFARLDADGDGFINAEEAPKGPPKDPIADFDEDGDGKLSIEEFPGPDDHFTRFDQNRDGYLEEDEMPQGPPRHGKRTGQ